jgi:hypothetical protein
MELEFGGYLGLMVMVGMVLRKERHHFLPPHSGLVPHGF